MIRNDCTIIEAPTVYYALSTFVNVPPTLQEYMDGVVKATRTNRHKFLLLFEEEGSFGKTQYIGAYLTENGIKHLYFKCNVSWAAWEADSANPEQSTTVVLDDVALMGSGSNLDLPLRKSICQGGEGFHVSSSKGANSYK